METTKDKDIQDVNREAFLAIGLDAKRVESLLKNKKVSARLREVLEIAGVTTCDKHIGNLIDFMAGKLPDNLQNRTKLLCDFIIEGKLTKTPQIEAGVDFLSHITKTKGAETEIDRDEFASVCGVGVVVSDEEIEQVVKRVFEENKEAIAAKGHDFSINTVLYRVKELIKWAD
jgi:glutaminyl-tRNA synthetase